MVNSLPSVFFVVPCYNEECVLDSTVPSLLGELEHLVAAGLCAEGRSGLLFVDDGSKDRTWELIDLWSSRDQRVNGLQLSRNKGHQAALIAGLTAAAQCADVVISIDADLQDDVSVCGEMLSLYQHGYEIVYGVRGDRTTDSWSKSLFANSFYSLMPLIGIEAVSGHADFRLMSRRAVIELLQYEERSLFLRGIIPILGYKSASVFYSRKVRQSGTSKYPFRKSLTLAIDGIISLSYKPLRYIAYLGLFMSILSFCGMIAIIVNYLMGGTVQGWASIMLIVTIVGGLQLLALGVIGEYLGRVYREVKRRPRFHVQSKVGSFLRAL
ncbi:glycosyltransferase family 2 protein [Cyanobium sp. ULC084]